MNKPFINWGEEIWTVYTTKYGLTYGGLSAWPNPDFPQEMFEPTVDETLPGHWPHWFTIKEGPFEVLRPTRDDVQFVIDAFGDAHPRQGNEMFAEDRYARFCMTYHAYHRIEDLFPGDDRSPTELANNLCQNAVDMLNECHREELPQKQIATRLSETFDEKQLRTILFRIVRSYRMSGAQQDFFEFDPSLPDYMRALLMKVEEVDWHKSAKS
jgi:hypothetical protein